MALPMITPANIFADIPATLADEQFTELWSTPTLRVERIVSHGHASPPGFWFDQNDAEWVLVLQGAALIALEGGIDPVMLRRGDYLYLAPHARHRVEWTDPDQATVWLAIHHVASLDRRQATPTGTAPT
jgi:cupin 2 domain-containing protein